jgi:hypothetical protein
MQIAVTIPDELAAQAKTAEQAENFFAAMADGSETLPLLRTESFARETFYEDRH